MEASSVPGRTLLHPHTLPLSPRLSAVVWDGKQTKNESRVRAGAGEEEPMKRKKREAGGPVHRLLRVALLHRCPLHRPVTGLLPLISAVSGCLLLCFAVLSPLSPSPSVGTVRHSHSGSPDRIAHGLEAEFISSPAAVFVHSSGGSLSRDPWSSRLSDFFHGCCNASSGFLTADKKAQANRYLSIATSQRLNQQW